MSAWNTVAGHGTWNAPAQSPHDQAAAAHAAAIDAAHRGYIAYLQRTGNSHDQLVHEGGSYIGDHATPGQRPVPGANFLSVVQHGAHQGELGTTIRKGNDVFHVYYGAHGEREVVKLPPAMSAYLLTRSTQ